MDILNDKQAYLDRREDAGINVYNERRIEEFGSNERIIRSRQSPISQIKQAMSSLLSALA